jgi:hypothetical protein
VLAGADRWDEVTAGVVVSRLDPPTDYSFFTPTEQAAAGALFDVLLDQRNEPRIPVLKLVDQRMPLDQTDGWRCEDMPEDQIAWRMTLAALDADAQLRGGVAFHQLADTDQTAIVGEVQQAGRWHAWAGGHVWSLWTRYACAAFYSHPWAWNEIGFGGPAYLRGYKALGVGKRESWEVADASGRDPASPATSPSEANSSGSDGAGAAGGGQGTLLG